MNLAINVTCALFYTDHFFTINYVEYKDAKPSDSILT